MSSEKFQLRNRAPEPESAAAPSANDQQPHDTERYPAKNDMQSVIAEESDSTPRRRFSTGLTGALKRKEDHSKLRKEEGNRKFSERELRNEVKNGVAANDDVTREADTPHTQPTSKQQIERNNAAMELINSVTGVDEEGQSRQRVLIFAAKRYASELERNPEDYDALYNWALILQDSADNVSSEARSSKDALLKEACNKYEEATRLSPMLKDAYYNWAIAISDRAKMHGRSKEAEELWKEATKNYEKAVQLNWNSPQALNNWGLALQELSAIVPAREKRAVVKSAISKFRAAIQLQFDFHRAIYNLGTVLYGLAEDVLRSGEQVNAKEVSPEELCSQSAIYIAAAHALKPSYSVYISALKLVRSMLPRPYLKVGYLTAPPPGTPLAPHSDWQRYKFVLNHEALQQVEINAVEQSLLSGDGLKVHVSDIVSVSPSADLTLPPGAGLCIDTTHGTIFLIAESWASLDGWLDAIRLVYTIFVRGKSNVLAAL